MVASKQESKQANIHTQMHNAVPLEKLQTWEN